MALMKSEKNTSIITAYALLFTVAIGVVAEDLWAQRALPPLPMARKLTMAERAALASAKPGDAVQAQTTVASR